MNLITKFRATLHRIALSAWHGLWQRSDVGFRRMCVLASLHAQLLTCETTDSKAIQRLNEHMNLVADANALKFPTLFGNVIWKGIPTVEKMDLRTDRIVKRIMRAMPCWLNYGTDARLESDIKALIGYCLEAKCSK